jgi:hypothetical protein
MCPDEQEMLAQEVHEQRAGLHERFARLAVDGYRNLHHVSIRSVAQQLNWPVTISRQAG